MRSIAIPLSLLLALGLLGAFIHFTGIASASTQADLNALEMDLANGGGAYEIDLDLNGNLWISEYVNKELWQVNPATEVYTIYPLSGTPSDAHVDSNGNIWWADTENFRISRLSPSPANGITSWEFPFSGDLYGLEVESAEKIWVSDVGIGYPYLYLLDLSYPRVCTYTLPMDGSAGYLLFQDGALWFGDSENARVYRLGPDFTQYTYWQLPALSVPEGLTFDSYGNLWLAISIFGKLDRLEVDPNTDNGVLSRFSIPTGNGFLPEMVASIGGYLWYGELGVGTLGRLDPDLASHTTSNLTGMQLPAASDCSPIQPSGPVTVHPTSDPAAFTSNLYTTRIDSAGWLIYDLPDGSWPWGIAYRDGDAWIVDNARQKLIHVPDVPIKPTQIIVQKQTDPEGSLQSFEFDPSVGGNFSLTDGAEHVLGPLSPGTYSVSEVNLPSRWTQTSATCDDGSLPSAIELQDGETVTCVFTNTQSAQIIIQKQTIPNDSPQSFEFDPSYGVNFNLTDNAQNVSGPLSAGSYSVSEVNLPPRWTLTSATCDDGSPPSAINVQNGETVTCVFTNTQSAQIIVQKQTDPDGSPQSFEFDPSYGVNFNLTDNAQNVSGPLSPGTYSISEVNLPSDWELTSATCDDDSPPSAIDLQDGETVTCVFTNSQQTEMHVYLPMLKK